MRRAPRLLLLLLSLLAAVLCKPAAAGPHAHRRQRSVRSRVSFEGALPGKRGPGPSARERAALSAAHNAGWSNASLAHACAAPPRGYDPPQWRREPPPSRRVAVRGWLVCAAAAQADTPLFALPGPAWPTREERFSATFKGKTRALSLSAADGVARLVRRAGVACVQRAN